jgi:hypothetical protein
MAHARWIGSDRTARGADALRTEGRMGDVAVDDYKASAARIEESWKSKIERPAMRMVEIDTEVREAAAKNPPGQEDQKRLADLKKHYETQRRAVRKANTESRLDLSLIPPPE